MLNSVDFVKKIEIILSEIGITQKEFAIRLGFSHGIVTAWKTSNTLPPVDTVFLVAKELVVSPLWLMNGDMDFEEHDSIKREYSRKSIRLRLYKAIRDKYIVKDPEDPLFREDYLHNEEKLEEIHKRYFGSGNYGYPTYKEFLNWSKGRFEIDEYWFVRCAQNFNTTLEFIYTGSEVIPSVDGYSKPFDNHLYDLAQTYRNELRCLDNYSPERLQLAKKLLNELMYLEDYEYKAKNKQTK